MKTKIILTSAALALCIAAIARAEVRQSTGVFLGRENVTNAVLTPLEGHLESARGYLQRITIVVTGGNNNLVISDDDGFLLLSNVFNAGTTTTWFTNATPPVFLGITVRGFSASTAATTNTIKILHRREQ